MSRFVSAPALLVLLLALGDARPGRAQTTPIHVVLGGADVAGADVFVDGQLRGRTDLRGNLSVAGALLQNGKTVLSARLLVAEVPAILPGHEDAASPRGWMMRAYVTSVTVDDSGKVGSLVVTDKTQPQELVLKRDNVLIGLQVLVSADWDMGNKDLVRLMETFQRASHYLWNATDGQFVFELVKIADQAQSWDRSEYRLFVDNTPRPRATMGGYLTQNAVGALVGSFISFPWRDSNIHLQGPWISCDFRTLVHEFGHLGFALMDEYGYTGPETCTPKRSTDPAGTPFAVGGAKAACVMDHESETNKFCSDQDPNPHSHVDLQPDDCWAGIRGGYSDPLGARWILKTPVTRNQIVGTLVGASGTASDAFPVEWNTNFVITNKSWPTALCSPFYQPVTFADGTPAPVAPVALLYTSIDPRQHTWISEGKTRGDGTIAILGAHQSDTVMTQREYRLLDICPAGIESQGPLGTIGNDTDGDHVPDGFDTCPKLFNPFRPTSAWVAQGPAGGATSPGCVAPPACTSDADCGPGGTCQTSGGTASCVVQVGQKCTTNQECSSGYCDAGNNTSKTGLCMPNKNGQTGELCSHDDQCTSRNCGGLAPDGAGGWRPGRCSAISTKPLGDFCFNHAQCGSGYCDAGSGTSKTLRCMPNKNGQTGDICSHDNQCLSGNCSGLRYIAGAWVPGACAGKLALGAPCTQHSQCGSGYCDSGNNTSRTDRCMPNNNGQPGDICSHHHQCTSRNCVGLHAQGNQWIPGQCN